MSTSHSWRSATAINATLIAAAASAVFLSAYGLASPDPSADGPGTSAATTNAEPLEAGPFIQAVAGDCITWDVDKDGLVTNFRKAGCEDKHRFEIASVDDLSIYPTSEFGKKAPRPSLERQAQLREEICQGATLNYLDGKFDPTGKYSIAPILPPEKSWQNGDRTMLCGLQTTNAKGTPLLTEGRVKDADQANIAAPGQCRAVGQDQVLRTVDCAQPHQLETVSVINLRDQFPDRFPSADEQNDYLNDACTSQAEDFLGGEENLYQSTLKPYWGSITESAWAGGTYSVNCSLMHVNTATGSFSTITGSATGGRAALNINGAPPTEQPARNPLRSELGLP